LSFLFDRNIREENSTIDDDNVVENVLDITIVNNSCGEIEQIYETYVSFKSLQYPSLFIFSEYEYQVDIKIRLMKDHKNVELTRERLLWGNRRCIGFKIIMLVW